MSPALIASPPPDADRRTAPRSRRALALAAALFLAISAFAVLGAGGTATAAPAVKDVANPTQYYVDQINTLRASLGLGALQVDPTLTALAMEHTQELAATQNLHHTPDLSVGIDVTWSDLGENVGMGNYTPSIWDAFVKSPGHYANLVNPKYTLVGIGVVVDANGIQWTTQRFMGVWPPVKQFVPPPSPQPPVTTPVPAAIPTPAPTPAPAPKPVAIPTANPTPAPTQVDTTGPVAPPQPKPMPQRRAAAVLDALHTL